MGRSCWITSLSANLFLIFITFWFFYISPIQGFAMYLIYWLFWNPVRVLSYQNKGTWTQKMHSTITLGKFFITVIQQQDLVPARLSTECLEGGRRWKCSEKLYATIVGGVSNIWRGRAPTNMPNYVIYWDNYSVMWLCHTGVAWITHWYLEISLTSGTLEFIWWGLRKGHHRTWRS